MKPCKDILIEDMGHKMGMNGVDNGRLSFNNVRIKRE
jgi:acyl-CoA oxidase